MSEITLAKKIRQVICFGERFLPEEHQRKESFSSSRQGRTASFLSMGLTNICTYSTSGNFLMQAVFTDTL